jgi:hypothetical protein
MSSNDIVRIGGEPERRGPKTYVREDGFQIVQGVTAVDIHVRVGRHVSSTRLTGFDMEAAMIANWNGKIGTPGRFGALQFGVRNAEQIISGSVFTFSTAWD